MSISWGNTSGHEQVGIEVITGSITSATTMVTVTVKFYVRSISWSFDDNQTLSDSFGDSHNFLFDVPVSTTQRLISQHSFTATPSYSGGPTYTFSAEVSGNYTGSNPSHSFAYRLPAKPASVPDQVVTISLTPTSNSVTIGWSAVDGNGSSVTLYQAQVDDNSNFSSPLYTNSVSGVSRSMIASGLTRATTYYVRVRAANGVGWGPWSSTRTFVTKATAPDSVSSLSFSDLTPSGAIATWVAPNSGGSTITGYVVQASERSDFATLAVNESVGASPLSYTFTTLMPATTYYVRVRAVNAIGTSSPGNNFTLVTLSGAKVKINGGYKNARVWVKRSGTWAIATVWKKSDGAWVI